MSTADPRFSQFQSDSDTQQLIDTRPLVQFYIYTDTDTVYINIFKLINTDEKMYAEKSLIRLVET